jgi:hypothetical protein
VSLDDIGGVRTAIDERVHVGPAVRDSMRRVADDLPAQELASFAAARRVGISKKTTNGTKALSVSCDTIRIRTDEKWN